MIFERSRYEFIDVEYFPAPDGSVRQTICVTAAAEQDTFQFSYDVYFCKDGDRIDLLASQYLGDPELWWAIAQANPQWVYFDYLPAGLQLRMPHAVPQR